MSCLGSSKRFGQPTPNGPPVRPDRWTHRDVSARRDLSTRRDLVTRRDLLMHRGRSPPNDWSMRCDSLIPHGLSTHRGCPLHLLNAVQHRSENQPS